MLMRPMTAVYLTWGDEVLLLHRQGSRVAEGKWIGTAGGHMEPHEITDPTACVLRELQEETGLKPQEVEGLALRYITMRRAGGEIRQNFYFFARLKEKRELTSNEGELRWFPWQALAGLNMPVSARGMLEHYLRTGRHDTRLFAAAARGQTLHFTEMD